MWIRIQRPSYLWQSSPNTCYPAPRDSSQCHNTAGKWHWPRTKKRKKENPIGRWSRMRGANLGIWGWCFFCCNLPLVRMHTLSQRLQRFPGVEGSCRPRKLKAGREIISPGRRLPLPPVGFEGFFVTWAHRSICVDGNGPSSRFCMFASRSAYIQCTISLFLCAVFPRSGTCSGLSQPPHFTFQYLYLALHHKSSMHFYLFQCKVFCMLIEDSRSKVEAVLFWFWSTLVCKLFWPFYLRVQINWDLPCVSIWKRAHAECLEKGKTWIREQLNRLPATLEWNNPIGYAVTLWMWHRPAATHNAP